MARCLIIGCGCRGRALAAELLAAGHAVRGTTRCGSGAAAIEAVGAEAFVADPDRVATLARALEHVTIACILLGSADDDVDRLVDLHGSRLEMLLTRMLDTTVRGIVYEARGTVEPSVLRAGAERVRATCEDSRIPYAILDVDPLDHSGWLVAASGAVDAMLS